MKVCHVASYYPGTHAHWGGAEQACKPTIDLLAGYGIEQTLVTSPPDNPGAALLPHIGLRGMEQFVPRALRPTVQGSRTVLVPLDPVIGHRFRRYLCDTQPDIVHLHNFKLLSLSVVAAAARRQIPVVLSVYDYWLFCPKDNLFTAEGHACEGPSSTKCLRCYRPKDR